MPKPNDPTNPDNAPNPPSVPARHTKDMDSTLPPGADAEERFNEFWRKNGTSIFVGIAIAAVVVIGMQTWRYIQQRQELATQAAFGASDTPEQLVSFAQDNEDHPLAGVAYMDLANDEYERGEYGQAAEHYKLASEKLSGSPLAERARLGLAMSELLGNNPDQGKTDLRQIVDNTANLQTTRSEAAYNLALQYWKEKNWQSLNDIVSLVETFEDGSVYTFQIRQLRDQIPQLQQ